MNEMTADAKKLAEKAHEGQFRKGSRIPYITHPIAVAEILSEAGMDSEIIAAGYLHDTIEDTDVTLDDLKILFGVEVAELVNGATEKRDPSMGSGPENWEERKMHTIEYLKMSASWRVKAVALADKLSNLRSISKDYETSGAELWKRFNAGKDKQKWYYGNLVKSLESVKYHMPEAYSEFRELYSKVFELSGNPG